MGRAGIRLNDIFCPESIAIIGASTDEQKEQSGWTGTLLSSGFKGRLYPVNPKAAGKILGLQAYPSLAGIEERIDFAILNLSPPFVPKALEDCAVKKVKVVHIFSAGFAETGTDQGKKLQAEIRSIIDRTGIRTIGPNCMGVHSVEGGISFANLPRKEGPSALVSQTGAGAARSILYGSRRGIYFGKAISYGNAVDLDSPDLVEMFADDPKTKYIALYIEGVKIGSLLFRAAKKCLANGKALIILKAGSTEAARQAVTSHTGALAGSEQAWEAFFAQTGAIRVYTLEEIVEELVALQYISQIHGRRVGIIGRGGGPGVIATELCEKANLSVPPFSEALRGQLAKITTASAGSMIRNPVEVGVGRVGAQQGYLQAFKILAQSGEVDLILTHLNPEAFIIYGGAPEWLNESISALVEVFKTLPKPVALVLPAGETPESREIVERAWDRCLEAGLAVFRSYESAANAISKFADYCEFLDRA